MDRAHVATLTAETLPLTPSKAEPSLAWLMPGVFVVLWSTGFIGSKLGLPYAEPMTFLALRFVIVALLMLVVSLAAQARWPSGLAEAGHIAVVGLLVQGAYLGGVFIAISLGLAAGIAALIVGLQPLLTAAVVGPVLGEEVTARQWLGFVLGLAGVVLVLWSKLGWGEGGWIGVVPAVAALVGMTVGTVYQKRFCGGMDLRSGTVIQNAVAALPMLIGASLFETRVIDWSGTFVFALGWLILVLSVGATILFFWLLRRGAAARVASFFYLVPPVTALMAYALFGETLGPTALVGMVVAAAGVAMVTRAR